MTEALQEKMGKDGLKKADLLEVLLDETNKDPIIFENDKGETLSFERIAVIPYEVKKEERLYCVLRLLEEIEGVGEDGVMLFFVDTDKDGNSMIQVEEDKEIAIAVFEKYYALLEKAEKAKEDEAEENCEEEEEEEDVLYLLLDETNKDPIIFENDNGGTLSFEQVAVIPYKVKKELRLYCLLSPSQEYEGLNENDVIVFFVDMLDIDKDGGNMLQVEGDEEVSSAVYAIYYDFLEKYQVEKNAIKEAIMLQPEHQKQIQKLLKKRVKVLTKQIKLNGKRIKREGKRIKRMLSKQNWMESE